MWGSDGKVLPFLDLTTSLIIGELTLQTRSPSSRALACWHPRVCPPAPRLSGRRRWGSLGCPRKNWTPVRHPEKARKNLSISSSDFRTKRNKKEGDRSRKSGSRNRNSSRSIKKKKESLLWPFINPADRGLLIHKSDSVSSLSQPNKNTPTKMGSEESCWIRN